MQPVPAVVGVMRRRDFRVCGITILDPSFPETLEIAGEAQPELFMAALRHFMKGGRKLPPAMSALSAAVVKALRTAFAESSLRVLVV